MTNDRIVDFISNTGRSEYAFFPAVVQALEQFENKNNYHMYKLIAFVNGKPFGKDGLKNAGGDGRVKAKQYVQPLKNVLAKALTDVDFTFKKGRPGVRIGGNGGLNKDVLTEMQRAMVRYHGKISVSSVYFEETFPTPEKKDVVYTKEQRRDKVIKGIERLMETYSYDKGTLKAIIDTI